MKKTEIQNRVLQNSKPLPLDKFNWDEKTRTFSTEESYLVLDFNGIGHCTFNTGFGCIFKTGDNCTFDTGSGCTFDTGSGCTFNTGSGCTFNTGDNCTFDTGSGCTFDTGSGCTFNTGSGCTFNTGSGCTFDTGSYCTFNTGFGCTFTVGKNSVIVRRDIFEVIQPEPQKTIKLNSYEAKGFTVIEEEKISIELTKEQLEKIKYLI